MMQDSLNEKLFKKIYLLASESCFLRSDASDVLIDSNDSSSELLDFCFLSCVLMSRSFESK